jgi:hypothetical protein
MTLDECVARAGELIEEAARHVRAAGRPAM